MAIYEIRINASEDNNIAGHISIEKKESELGQWLIIQISKEVYLYWDKCYEKSQQPKAPGFFAFGRRPEVIIKPLFFSLVTGYLETIPDQPHRKRRVGALAAADREDGMEYFYSCCTKPQRDSYDQVLENLRCLLDWLKSESLVFLGQNSSNKGTYISAQDKQAVTQTISNFLQTLEREKFSDELKQEEEETASKKEQAEKLAAEKAGKCSLGWKIALGVMLALIFVICVALAIWTGSVLLAVPWAIALSPKIITFLSTITFAWVSPTAIIPHVVYLGLAIGSAATALLEVAAAAIVTFVCCCCCRAKPKAQYEKVNPFYEEEFDLDPRRAQEMAPLDDLSLERVVGDGHGRKALLSTQGIEVRDIYDDEQPIRPARGWIPSFCK